MYTIYALSNLSSTYGNIGNYDKAYELIKYAYHSFSDRYGQNHPSTQKLKNNVLVAHMNLVRNPHKSANQKYIERCHDLRRQVDAYRNTGNLQKELEATHKLYNLLFEFAGEEKPETLRVMYDLSVVYREIGDYKKALEWAEKGYEIQHRLLGDIHPDTRSTVKNLIFLYKKLGKHQQASALIKQKCMEYFYSSVFGQLFRK